MSKNIVFCADGTWNAPGAPDSNERTGDETNVFKLFANLDGAPAADTFAKEQERTSTGADGMVRQIAKYLHGVGDSTNLLVKLLGGAVGAGLITRIVRGYTFVSRNYAAGDKIFLVGFSRGAYTARALAGLIAAKGLLDATKLDLGDKVDAYRFGAAAWYDYRRAKLTAAGTWLGHLEETVGDIPGFVLFMWPPRADQFLAAPVEAVAVWDTVGAYGIPEYDAQLIRRDVFQFADLKLSTVVQRGFHAVAVDEKREDFMPTLWDFDPRVTQVLFAGSHGDVGGGYPNNECGLSDATLLWMTRALTQVGVQFSPSPIFAPNPNPKGPAHSPWAHPPWDVLLRRSRVIPGGLGLSQSVLDRIADGPVVADPGDSGAPYNPPNLTDYIAGHAAKAGIDVIP